MELIEVHVLGHLAQRHRALNAAVCLWYDREMQVKLEIVYFYVWMALMCVIIGLQIIDKRPVENIKN